MWVIVICFARARVVLVVLRFCVGYVNCFGYAACVGSCVVGGVCDCLILR